MSRYILMLSLLLFAGAMVAIAQPNFVGTNQADLLMITHEDLRTPNWYPGSPNAWETKLLNQKAIQGLTIGLYQIQDGQTAVTIRDNIPQTGANLSFILIIGDADRDEISLGNPVWPVSSSELNCFVPLLGDIVPAGIVHATEVVLENDLGYLANLSGVTVGRIPAQSLAEINTYLDKTATYIELFAPTWAKSQCLLFDDRFRNWTGCAPGATKWWEWQLRTETPSDWTTHILRTSAFPDFSVDPGPIATAFQNALNQGQGLITTLGAAAGLHAFSMAYFWDSPYQFSQNNKYPLVLGFNCDIGSFQKPVDNFFDRCVAEKLLFQQNAGPIAFIAPTNLTLYRPDGWTAQQVYQFLCVDNIRQFGNLWQHVVDLRNAPDAPNVSDWQWLNLVLLGDPTLVYPLGVNPSGRWLASESPIHVTESLTIEPNQTLTIEAGTTVIFSPGTSLRVAAGAKLIADGTSQALIHFQAVDSNPANAWSGISVYSDDTENLLNWCTIDNATIGVFVRDGYTQVRNCTIENCTSIGVAWVRSSGVVSNSALQNNSRFGAYVIDSGTNFTGNSVRDNGAGGMRFWRAGMNQLSGNTIITNGTSQPQNSYWAGVQILNGGTILQCNDISGNEGPGLMLFSQTFAEMADQGGRNDLTDNLHGIENLGYDYGQMTLMGGQAAMACGANTLADVNNEHYLVRDIYEGPVAPLWSVTQNYWGTTESNNIASRLPAGAVFSPFLNHDFDCNGTMPLCFEEPVELMFWNGWHQEREAQYAGAIATYEELVDLYPDKPQAKIALERIEFCQKALDWTWSDIRDYFLLLAADSSKDSTLVILCKSNAAWSLAEMGNFQGAYAELDSLLDHADAGYELMTLTLKMLLLELEEDSYSMLNHPDGSARDRTGLDAAAAVWEENFRRIDLKVDSVLAGFALRESSKRAASVPAEFALHQNYPNPFNPTTEIRFDLPEAVRVELKVFNILGQEVATLIDAVRPAGAYRVQWDSRSTSRVTVSSGVYVYQIKAGTFVDSKKMVLIR